MRCLFLSAARFQDRASIAEGCHTFCVPFLPYTSRTDPCPRATKEIFLIFTETGKFHRQKPPDKLALRAPIVLPGTYGEKQPLSVQSVTSSSLYPPTTSPGAREHDYDWYSYFKRNAQNNTPDEMYGVQKRSTREKLRRETKQYQFIDVVNGVEVEPAGPKYPYLSAKQKRDSEI